MTIINPKFRDEKQVFERITEEFYASGKSLNEFLEDATDDEKNRTMLYYKKLEKKFVPEDFRIDITFPVNFLVLATTWCWDSITNVPVLVRIAENSPNINIKIFNKDKYPFLIDKINGGEKVPQVLILSKDFYYLDRWVERSTLGYKLLSETRKEYGWKKENFDAFLKEYRRRFLRQQEKLEIEVIEEIKYLLNRIDAVQGTTSRFFK
jgi:hypothetical protein